MGTARELRHAALAVLRKNDLGGWTKPAPRLYPHQWSWDSAFIAIGLARVDLDRALRELETLFAAQWSDGRVPHIVFNPEAAEYFPGPEWWASVATNAAAPRHVATSGLIQPPVHALALQRIYQLARAQGQRGTLELRMRRLYEQMLAWHRYLAEARDPGEHGLLVIYHPWESGTDNSPRWDAALSRMTVGELPKYQRHDLKVVGDPNERPTQSEYDRYVWLVELLKVNAYVDAAIQHDHPFLIRDVLMSAIFAAACTALADAGRGLDAEPAEIETQSEYAARFCQGVQHAFDPELGLALDRDERADQAVRVETCAGLAPILLPESPQELTNTVVQALTGKRFAGADGLAHAVVPSTAPNSPGFKVRSYWRGPMWPVANWLFWWGLQQHGYTDVAANLKQESLELLNRPTSRFAEYFEPYTAEPLGSPEQSWTAAVTLDWLAAEDYP